MSVLKLTPESSQKILWLHRSRKCTLAQLFHQTIDPHLLPIKSPPSLPQIPHDQRGRQINKGKARVCIVGFDAINHDNNKSLSSFLPSSFLLSYSPYSVAPMAMSRSGPRISWNWRPASHSCSLGVAQPMPHALKFLFLLLFPFTQSMQHSFFFIAGTC